MHAITGFETSADKFIGATLYAKTPAPLWRVPGYDSAPFQTIPAGGLIGVINSWITRDGSVYWAFTDNLGRYFYVKHVPGAFVETAEIKAIIAAEEIAADQALKDQLGPFQYYFEKYGKIILITVAGIVIATTVIKNQPWKK